MLSSSSSKRSAYVGSDRDGRVPYGFLQQSEIGARPARQRRICVAQVVHAQGSPIQLRPRQNFLNAYPVLLIINECESFLIGPQIGTFPQYSRDGRLKHRLKILG